MRESVSLNIKTTDLVNEEKQSRRVEWPDIFTYDHMLSFMATFSEIRSAINRIQYDSIK